MNEQTVNIGQNANEKHLRASFGLSERMQRLIGSQPLNGLKRAKFTTWNAVNPSQRLEREARALRHQKVDEIAELSGDFYKHVGEVSQQYGAVKNIVHIESAGVL